MFEEWIGRTETATQVAERWPVMGLCAALDKNMAPDQGQALPLGSHWLYFGPMVPQSRIGPDGHPYRGEFLPPLPQPRRMWAASDIVFSGEIRIGDVVTKTSRIADFSSKGGKTGVLVFLRIEHSYVVNGAERLLETQTVVFRDHPSPSETPAPSKPAPENPAWSRRIDPDPVLLFRYSAVTFNAHRIHYDQPYVTGEEGYPGIIVQGQLTATLLLDQFMAQHPDRIIKTFNFRAVKPLFSGQPFFVEGAAESTGAFKLWARDAEGVLAMTADVTA